TAEQLRCVRQSVRPRPSCGPGNRRRARRLAPRMALDRSRLRRLRSACRRQRGFVGAARQGRTARQRKRSLSRHQGLACTMGEAHAAWLHGATQFRSFALVRQLRPCPASASLVAPRRSAARATRVARRLLGLATLLAVAWDSMLSPSDTRTLKIGQRQDDGEGSYFDLARAKTGKAAAGTLSQWSESILNAYLSRLGV